MDELSIRDLYDGNPLTPNHALSSLPPLPQTPHHARQSYDDEGDVVSSRPEPRSQKRRGGAREEPMTVNRVQGLDPGKLSDIGILTPARLPRSTTLPSLPTDPNPFTNRPREEQVYPTLSMRQSSFNTARTSPTKTGFLSPVRQPSALLHPPSATRQHPSSPYRTNRMASNSFMLPNGGDVSMLQDVTFGDLGRVSLGNDSVDMDFGPQQSYAGRREEEVTVVPGAMSVVECRNGVSPEKAMVQSAYPRSPFKRSSRPSVQPDSPTAAQNSNARDTFGADARNVAGLDSVTAIRDQSTTINGNTSRQPGSVRRQTKPSSSHFLAPPRTDNEGDTSSIFPVSPLKTRHLLSDEHMLTRTELHDESMLNMSLFIPPTTPGRSRQTAKTSAEDGLHMESPIKSPLKTPRSMRKRAGMDVGDMTMDIQQMMARAKVNKAKTDMGPEESFVDLLRADLAEDNLSTSLDDDSFIPLTLRPGLVRSKSLSRLEMEKRGEAPLVKELKDGMSVSPSRSSIKPRLDSFIERKDSADPSPVRGKVAVPSAGVPSKCISLSAGARPFPTSSSLKNLNLPLGRVASPVKTGQARSAVPVNTLPRSSTLTSLPKPIARPAAKSSMPPPAPPSMRAPQASKSRTGSSASIAAISAPATGSSTLSRTSGTRPASKPSLVPAASSRSATSSRPSVRPSTQTQRSTGTFSHATTTGMPRLFGTDAMGTSNRTSRPTSVASSKAPVKNHTAPTAATSTDRRAPPTGLASKARTLSTPASVVSQTSRPPMTPAAPLKRLSAAPTAASRPSTLPPSRPTGATAPLRTFTQTANGSRAPATSLIPEIQRAATIPKSSSTALAAAGLADIRARLDRLQARHQTSKAAK